MCIKMYQVQPMGYQNYDFWDPDRFASFGSILQFFATPAALRLHRSKLVSSSQQPALGAHPKWCTAIEFASESGCAK